MDVDYEHPVDRRVLLYTSRDADEPFMVFCQEVTSELPPILEGLSECYSPVKSKCLYFTSSCFCLIIIVIRIQLSYVHS